MPNVEVSGLRRPYGEGPLDCRVGQDVTWALVLILASVLLMPRVLVRPQESGSYSAMFHPVSKLRTTS